MGKEWRANLHRSPVDRSRKRRQRKESENDTRKCTTTRARGMEGTRISYEGNGMHLRSLFADDPERGERLTVKALGSFSTTRRIALPMRPSSFLCNWRRIRSA